MIELDQTRDIFIESLQNLFAKRRLISGPLNQIRSSFWQKLMSTPLPTRKSEQFRYFPLKEFYREKYEEVNMEVFLHPDMLQQAVLPECQNSTIVFVNGKLRLDLSMLTDVHKKMVLLPLDKAMQSYEIFLANRYHKTLAEERNPFVLLNLALSQEGGFIYIPPDVVVEKPIQILHFVSGREGIRAHIHPKWQIFAGSGAKANFISTFHFLKPGCGVWINQDIDVVLEDRASVSITSDQVIPDGHYIFESIRSTQKKASKFSSLLATAGSKAIRQELNCRLQGEEAEVDLSGFWLAHEKRQAHVVATVRHEAPNTRSNQLFKGVLADESVSSFEGKIYVESVAQQTEAYQLNKNLLLGETAKAYMKPNLEIFADDVKASHGATASYLSEEDLFYFQARGIDYKTAAEYLTSSFVKDVIQKVSLGSLSARYLEMLK